MVDFRKVLVSPGATLRETMAAIDQGAVEIALVADEQGRLLGTVSDGDIRRALLRGLSQDVQISQVMNTHFTSVRPDAQVEEVLNLMQARSIKHIPVIDSECRLIGLHLLQDLIEVKERPNWVVIMAGGRGLRLRPLTESVPKPMLTVNGQPLLERTVTQLVAHGFRRLFLSICYLGNQIQEHFEDGKRFGCRIDYLKEEKPLGTGGALSLLPERPKGSLLVINGDLLTNTNFTGLMDYHSNYENAVTLCVKELIYEIPYGVVGVNGHNVIDLQEKPTQRFFVNAGIYVLEPHAVDLVPRNEEYSLPQLVDAVRKKGEAVGAYPIREEWVDIGRLEDYRRVQMQLGEGDKS